VAAVDHYWISAGDRSSDGVASSESVVSSRTWDTAAWLRWPGSLRV